MDLKRAVLMMMVLCSFLLFAASLGDFFTHHQEDGLYDIDHLTDHMLQPQSGYEDFSFYGRNMLEGTVMDGRDRHGFPSTMDRHEKRDVQALLSFKSHIKLDPSGKLSNWTAENSKEVCSWFGITCRPHTRRVVALILPVAVSVFDYGYTFDPQLQLGGILSPSLSNLSLLHTLNLSGNYFNGGIPSVFGQLKALRVLDLSFNVLLEGSIPAEFGRLVELEHLILSGNGLSGTLPTALSNCTSLRELSISSNSLHGSIPTFRGLMRSLSYLDLSWNSLSGHIPPALGNSTQLSYIDFSFNNLSGRIPDLGKSDKLSHIDFSSNYLSGTIPALANYTQLLYIGLFGNNISGRIPIELRLL